MITKIILHKYKRFMLNGINTLVYTPDKTIQLIAGTNGAGKSSLLNETSPLPADINKDFHKGGYKEVHLTLGSDTLVVTSGKIGPTKHEFIFNGENINKGGTKKIQLELCKTYLKLTPAIHKVLVNSKNFTDMSIAERRTWLTDISTIDYTYSLGVFKKIQVHYRDIVGAIKLIDSKITTAETNSIGPEQLSAYRNELDALEELLGALYGELTSTEASTYDRSRLISDTDRLNRLTSIVRDSKKVRLDVMLHKKKELEEKIKFTLETLERSMATDESNKTLLMKEINEIEEYINERDFNVDDGIYIKLFRNNYDAIQRLIGDIIEYIDYDISTDISNDRARIDKIDHELTIVNRKLSTTTSSLYHLRDLKNNDDIKCPKCNYVWKDGFDEAELKMLESAVNEYNSTIDKLKSLRDKTVETVQTYDEASKRVSNLRNYIKSVGLSPFLDDILLNAILPKDIYKVSNEIESRLAYVDNLENYIAKTELLDRKLNQLEDITKLEELSKDIIVKSTKELELTVNNLYNELSNVEKKITEGKKHERLMREIESVRSDIENGIESYEKHKKHGLDAVRNKYISKHIDNVKKEIRRLRNVVSDSEYSMRMLASMKDDKESYKKERDRLLLLINVLSPTEGLIAESIMSFVGVFVERINELIGKIWTYKMELLVPDTDDGDLDYKFRVVVEDNDPIDDMNLVSSGMKEIINLSHRLIVMNTLGLTDYPIYLDEFGSKFDPVHRDKTIDIIKDLSNAYSQIFIVSHNQDIFNIFKDCDINVISGDNLFMSDVKEYNKNIKIS